MNEPSPRTSRLALAGGLAAAIVIGGAGVLIGRSTAPAPAPAPSPSAAPSPTPTQTPIAVTPSAMGRAELLELADRAADAVSSGTPIPEEVRAAAGRRFDLVLPFGCDGPGAMDRTTGLGWRYEAESETLRIRVNPARWSPADWTPGDGDEAKERLEGFWIARPWSSSPQCPAASARGGGATGSEPVLLPGQTLAIAQPAQEDKQRPPRALETVQRVAGGDFDAAKGFHLRITGRIDSTHKDPVRCMQPAGGEQRPLCLIRGDFTEVRIENPVDGKVLAAWPMSGPAPRAD